ncbi:hypothetical protein DFH07DRAFT_990523 [Mycena maculata]|uniref:Uncharacterized protein n=1 Tax=Mycena maculata TaxID=230809 RepID=A0AAD7MTZ6_9AGAR|nr:hypothetical protein DFH07DRAFT_990523 [Mycena maculata]
MSSSDERPAKTRRSYAIWQGASNLFTLSTASPVADRILGGFCRPNNHDPYLRTAYLRRLHSISGKVMLRSLATISLPSLTFMASTLDPAFVTGVLDKIQVSLYILTAEVFLYGIYAVLFGFYVHILYTRGISNNPFLTGATISLFLLCTAHLALLAAIAVSANQTYEGSAVGTEPQDSTVEVIFDLIRVANGVYVTCNIIADAIFIFRCYAIWNFRRLIIIVPILLTAILAVSGYGNSFSSPDMNNPTFEDVHLAGGFNVAVVTSLLTTLILMGLSAGRIWWLARTASQTMGRKITGRYYAISAMILESGALYCVGGIVFLVISYQEVNNATIVGAVLGQLVGIAPTIIAVRVGLGQSVESVDSFIAPARPPRPLVEVQPAASRVYSTEQRVLYIRPESDHDVGMAEVV